MPFCGSEALAFSCTASGLDCCYVGEEWPVYAATARLEQAVDKLEQGAGSGVPFWTSWSCTRSWGDPGHCRPGRSLLHLRLQAWTFRVNYSSVDLICRTAGRKCAFPRPLPTTLTTSAAKPRLLIRGKENQ